MRGIRYRVKRRIKRIMWLMNRDNWIALFPQQSKKCYRPWLTDEQDMADALRYVQENPACGLGISFGEECFDTAAADLLSGIVMKKTVDFYSDRDAFINAWSDIVCCYDIVLAKERRPDVRDLENCRLFIVITRTIEDCQKLFTQRKHCYVCHDLVDVARVSSIVLSANNIRNLRLRGNAVVRTEFITWIERFKKTCESNDIPLSSACIVGSAPMEICAIKQAADIDFVVDTQTRKKLEQFNPHFSNLIEIAHKDYVRDGGSVFITDDDLIHNDMHHFVYMGCKFANLEYVFYRKMHDFREKDIRASTLFFTWFLYSMRYTDKPILMDVIYKSLQG